jgi:hypothetical protein
MIGVTYFITSSVTVALLLLTTAHTSTVFAQSGVECPSNEMRCTELDNNGGCQSPCVRTLTYTGQPYARCACLLPVAEGSRACGESCGRNQDCAPECPYCWTAQGSPVCRDGPPGPGSASSSQFVFCDESGNPVNEPVEDNERIYTAIGCVPIGSNTALASFFLRWAIGIGGGIAFIMIVYSGFLIISSAGNPQRLQAGKELLFAAISGLLLMLFSVFILRFIGVSVLEIPGIN